METAVNIDPDFWTDGSVWVGVSEHSVEGAGLAEMALRELKAKDWCFFQTSGTEGARKWVGLTKQALLISARAVNEHFGITERDHWLLALPTHHVGGFGILARAHLSGSVVTRLEGKWNAAAFVQKCENVGATLASLVPTQIFDLVAAELRAPATMRAVLVGGGALNAELEAAAMGLGWQVHRTYAMTETGSSVAAQPRPGAELEVLPIWQVNTDAEGVLTISGPALAQGYAICEEGHWRWEPIPAEGLRTRDRVEIIEAEGTRRLRFLGREAGTVKILGELVALGPIQDRIEALRLKLGSISADAAVCDVADARKESRLVLAVSGMTESEAAQMQKGLNETLRPFEQIQDVRLLHAIPRSDLGKVLLAGLRELL
ncbi:AMP-binding protein [Prosthecobacter sp.]|jgi:O-succinylbenzoic acid--CoA ligase|uniref:AMP-binding protein n=1 Tax=Prosthecobacter sp. TaxID=1965333 RepID=UPI0037C6C3B9